MIRARHFAIAGIITIVGLIAWLNWPTDRQSAQENSIKVLRQSWKSYKDTFIHEGGVVRLKEQDTVSEGMAYAMMRSLWMDDKEVFDQLYEWSEKNLSRLEHGGDHLLSWRWAKGATLDSMPASDADIDYGFSLLFAAHKWPDQNPRHLMTYQEKARRVLSDILEKETVRLDDGRLYLTPWILTVDEKLADKILLNPSYYSPAFFRLFYEFSKDIRWSELINTSYYLLLKAQSQIGNKEGVGFIPDWVDVSRSGEFFMNDEKGAMSSWEAVRIPLRIAFDYYWFQSSEAKQFFKANSNFIKHLEKTWRSKNRIESEYGYSGVANNSFENALFYASYYVSTEIANSPISDDIYVRLHYLSKASEEDFSYGDNNDYYVNSLAWMADGFRSGLLSKHPFTGD
ncbi:MAG: endo-1,4-beta-D-glucanase Y [Candidatus Omnitrophota bacterium]|jgi:endo-1,4-beta-D-glucanase Y